MNSNQNLMRTEPPKAPPQPELIERSETIAVPAYLDSVYHNSYFVPFFVGLQHDDWLTYLRTFFQIPKLVKSVTNEISPDMKVVQFGIASGKIENAIADKLNNTGAYHIEDLSEAQIDKVSPRVSPWLNVKIKMRDFTIPNDEKYDTAVLFFALHELPDTRKKQVIARALDCLKSKGKVVFIDYAHPARFNPLKPFLKLFNRLYEPFAESLWYNDIESFAPKSDNFIWAKKPLFGGVYQCVIAQKK